MSHLTKNILTSEQKKKISILTDRLLLTEFHTNCFVMVSGINVAYSDERDGQSHDKS